MDAAGFVKDRRAGTSFACALVCVSWMVYLAIAAQSEPTQATGRSGEWDWYHAVLRTAPFLLGPVAVVLGSLALGKTGRGSDAATCGADRYGSAHARCNRTRTDRECHRSPRAFA